LGAMVEGAAMPIMRAEAAEAAMRGRMVERRMVIEICRVEGWW
jgi:hypothetical protein